jgi:hypothetical protein
MWFDGVLLRQKRVMPYRFRGAILLPVLGSSNLLLIAVTGQPDIVRMIQYLALLIIRWLLLSQLPIKPTGVAG